MRTTLPEPEDPQDPFQRLLIAGRWLLVAAQVAVTPMLLAAGSLHDAGLAVLVLLFAYSAAALVIVQRIPVRRLPVRAILALDLAGISLAAHYTGGSRSPFLGLVHLVVLAAAVLYDTRGGFIMGIAAALLAAALAGDPRIASPLTRNLAFSYILIGGFTGHLAGTLKAWFVRYRRSQAEIRERELQDRLLRQEMELARRIQQAALAPPPDVPGLDLAVHLEFAREVGGDFCLFPPAGERLRVVIGDVSGKGLPAALVSTTIAYLLPSLLETMEPVPALDALNRALRQRLPPDAFVSLLLAEADLPGQRVDLWNAGHPPPLLWRAREGRVREADVFNPVLGVAPGCECRALSWPFEPGDVLVLYSDGLTEARSPAGELFEAERVSAVLQQHAAGTAAQIAAALAAEAAQWGSVTDDLTLVVCKRVPETPHDNQP